MIDINKDKKVILFGYGKFGRSIANTLLDNNTEIILVESQESNYNIALQNKFKEIRLIDVTDDASLLDLPVEEEHQLICVMDDDHLNVFLVLSLRALFPKNKIFAISDSIHATRKLKMAGANKVIDLYSISATRIHNILNKPIATRFLEGFLDWKHQYSFYEITIPKNSFLHGKKLKDVDFHKYGIIFIGMIDVEMGHSFIFVTTGLDHTLDTGDIIVCIGRDEDLKRFEESISFPKERV